MASEWRATFLLLLLLAALLGLGGPSVLPLFVLRVFGGVAVGAWRRRAGRCSFCFALLWLAPLLGRGGPSVLPFFVLRVFGGVAAGCCLRCCATPKTRKSAPHYLVFVLSLVSKSASNYLVFISLPASNLVCVLMLGYPLDAWFMPVGCCRRLA